MRDRRAEKESSTSFLDHIDALRVVRAEDDAAKTQILDDIGADGYVEQQIVIELARKTPVLRPAEFPAAHQNLMHALEVLDRNGDRQVTVHSGLPLLRPLRALPVQLVTRWIVKSHVNHVARSVRQLYELREASAVPGSAEHRLLRRARMDAARVESGLRTGQLPLPTFVLGGAFLTGAFSAVLSAGLAAARNTSVLVSLATLTVLLLIGGSWVALYSAAVTRQRIRLTTDWAVPDVYRALGAAGRPPRDHSYNLAIVAITLTLAAVLVVPLAAWLLVWDA